MTPTDKEKTFRIGEAAELLELETYVLRFWETEFPHLAPLRTPKGQRLYAEHHIEQLRRVKHLLHEQGFTIEGARRVLEAEAGETALPEPTPCQGFLFPTPLAGQNTGSGTEQGQRKKQEKTAASTVEACGTTVDNGPELDPPRLQAALRQLHGELLEVRELLRSLKKD